MAHFCAGFPAKRQATPIRKKFALASSQTIVVVAMSVSLTGPIWSLGTAHGQGLTVHPNPSVDLPQAAAPGSSPAAASAAATRRTRRLPDIVLQAGESHVLAAPNVGRIAVGDGKIISAAALDGREVILFANEPGESSLYIWGADGHDQRVKVIVRSPEQNRVEHELQALLSRMPSVQASLVGDRVIVEGSQLSELERRRLAMLIERYPQIVDFTEPEGHDRMVRLDVRVMEFPRVALRDLGIRWSSTPEGGVSMGVGWDAAGRGTLLARPGESPLAIPFPSSGLATYLGINALLSAKIQALVQNGDAVMLAEPQLSARNGATARFLAGGEVPYVSTDRDGNSTTIFKPYGVALEVSPRIDSQGHVRAQVAIEVSAVDSTVSGPSGPALKVRRTTTEFQLPSGGSMIISGFLSREQSEDMDRVPGLSSLPILGPLFRSRRFQSRETELVIVVTPHVFDGSEPVDAQAIEQAMQRLAEAFPEPASLITHEAPQAPIHHRGDWHSSSQAPNESLMHLHESLER